MGLFKEQPGGDIKDRPVSKLSKKLSAPGVYDADMVIVATESGPGRIIVRVGHQENVGVSTALELLDKPGVKIDNSTKG